MKTNYLFISVAIGISIAFFSVLSIIGFPNSVEGWIFSDVILGVILYLSYLLLVLTHNSSRKKHNHTF